MCVFVCVLASVNTRAVLNILILAVMCVDESGALLRLC